MSRTIIVPVYFMRRPARACALILVKKAEINGEINHHDCGGDAKIAAAKWILGGAMICMKYKGQEARIESIDNITRLYDALRYASFRRAASGEQCMTHHAACRRSREMPPEYGTKEGAWLVRRPAWHSDIAMLYLIDCQYIDIFISKPRPSLPALMPADTADQSSS